MTRGSAAGATDAAEELLGWIERRSADPATSGSGPGPAKEHGLREYVAPQRRGYVPPQISDEPAGAPPVLDDGPQPGGSAIQRLANTDWLHHRLTIRGPTDEVEEFRLAAAGSGIIPWVLDLDRMEEGYFHLLASPEPPQKRSLSVAGARIFARQLRDAVGQRHDLATSRVGRSRECPFDLHALLPVPPRVLALGPDEPKSHAWLWERWGTTQALRHVTRPPPARNAADEAKAVMLVEFWSADWTPWQALRHVAASHPALRFDCRPTYDAP